MQVSKHIKKIIIWAPAQKMLFAENSQLNKSLKGLCTRFWAFPAFQAMILPF
jgi:hypothetical protein